MDVENQKIYRVTTQQVRNSWNEILFEAGVVVQATNDLGGCYLARPINTDVTPRMLYKDECRPLSEIEEQELNITYS